MISPDLTSTVYGQHYSRSIIESIASLFRAHMQQLALLVESDIQYFRRFNSVNHWCEYAR